MIRLPLNKVGDLSKIAKTVPEAENAAGTTFSAQIYT